MNVLKYFEERFGIPESLFDEFGIYAGPKGRVYLGPKKLPGKPDIVSPGLLIARAESAVKPTTNFLQLFGKHATKNIISLSKEQAVSYAKGEDLRISSENDGYIIAEYSGNFLGCGMLKSGILINQIPKAKRQLVKYI